MDEFRTSSRLVGSNGLSRDSGDAFGDPPPASASLAAWLEALSGPEPRLREALCLAYGEDSALIAERCSLYRSALSSFKRAFGDQDRIVLLAVPSRINWEGHHVDHQGGYYNATTHSREMVFAVRGRTDRRVRLVNAQPERFQADEFEILETPAPSGRRHCWSDYVRGAFAALGRRNPGRQLLGADIAVASDIPVGASLSSSHALVLGSALCALGTNHLTLDKRDAVILVQEGEWYTGSRTGLGDQATMIFGRRGKLFCSAVGERDHITPRYVDIPAGYAHLIIDSFTEHHLQGEERIDYNARVFASRTAFPLLLAALLEQGAPLDQVTATRRLGDIAPNRFSTAAIYRALQRFPDSLSFNDARLLFAKAIQSLSAAGVIVQVVDFDELVTTYFGSGPHAARLPVKGVALYALAECWRSRLYAELLERGQFAAAGRIVNLGHDGDRVARRDPDTGRYVTFEHPVTNALLDELLSKLGDYRQDIRASAALECQSGEYRASIAELDVLVDICREAGAVSASLTGAGLGGVVTTVIAENRVAWLQKNLFAHFENAEDAEVALVVNAVQEGRIAPAVAEAVRSVRDTKRLVREPQHPFAPSAHQQQALELCRRELVSKGNGLVRLLPVDYYRNAIARNGSVAGAGYLPAPG
jgi:galactokinase